MSWIKTAVIQLSLVLFSFLTFSVYAFSVYRQETPIEAKVQKLRKGIYFGVPIIAVLTGLANFFWVYPSVLSRIGNQLARKWVITITLITISLNVLMSSLASYFGLIRYIARLRETEKSIVRHISLFFGIGAVLVFAFSFSVSVLMVSVSKIAVVVGIVLFGFVIISIAPYVINSFRDTETLSGDIRESVDRLIEESGVEVKDVKVVNVSDKQAGIFSRGILPGHNFIFVTDYLIDNLTEDEAVALIVRELGNVKKKRDALHYLALVSVIVPVLTLMTMNPDAFFFMGIATMILYHAFVVGILHNKMVYITDKYATKLVDEEDMISGLQKVVELNSTEKEKSKLYELVTRYPSPKTRIKRLKYLSEKTKN